MRTAPLQGAEGSARVNLFIGDMRLLPDKGKSVARRRRKVTDQAWGLMAGLPKEGSWTAHCGAVRGLHHRKDLPYARA